MKIKTVLIAGALAATLAGPAQAGPASPPPKQDAATLVIPAPPAGKGQIVFYRKSTLMGAPVGCTVHENGKKISSLGVGKYFIVLADPGRHLYSVKSEATDQLALEVEPDETQFASCRIKMGIMVGRPDITPSTEAEFRSAKSLRLVDADDMGEGARRPDEVLAPAAAPAAEPAPAVPAGTSR